MNIAEAAAEREALPASLVHVWAIDGKPYQTWAEVEAHVAAFVTAEGHRWDGLVVWSCYGVRAGSTLAPLAASGTVPFAVAEWPGGEVKWTLAPPGAGQPVFATGRLVGWAVDTVHEVKAPPLNGRGEWVTERDRVVRVDG